MHRGSDNCWVCQKGSCLNLKSTLLYPWQLHWTPSWARWIHVFHFNIILPSSPRTLYVVLPWGFLTHFDGISHIIFLCVNIVIMCRSVNYEAPQTQKSNILEERRMSFEFFTMFVNHVLWMFSLLKKCSVL